jgi:predicted glycoside hydrolase/deacetylase ChbG (UPF0249 family)
MFAMTVRRLVIFNADDFGLTDGVCRGILEAIGAGVVTATTAMVCSHGSHERLARWGASVAGHVGIHLQLTQGRSCVAAPSIPSIVNADGTFADAPSEMTSPDLNQVQAEWSAQIERLKSWGIEPTHMDSHHHVGLNPRIVDAYIALAVTTGLPARTTSPELTAALRARGARCVDLSLTSWYDRDLSAKGLLRRIEAAFDRLHGGGTVEVMCHPGLVDDELAPKSKYVRQREVELSVLTSDKLMRGLDRLDVELGRMGSLAN